MKTKLLFFFLLFGVLLGYGQTEHFITWQVGVNGSAASLEIQVGDTVTWTWGDAIPHTVSSTAGSTETFSSATLTGVGQTYSRVFNVEGVNNYQCNVHPGSMFGTITVTTLSTIDYSKLDFSIFPNPSSDKFTIELPRTYNAMTMEVYNVLGKKIVEKQWSGLSNKLTLDATSWSKGVYLVKLKSDNMVQTKKFIKQ